MFFNRWADLNRWTALRSVRVLSGLLKPYCEDSGTAKPAWCVSHFDRRTPPSDTGSGRDAHPTHKLAPHRNHSPCSKCNAQAAVPPDSQTHCYIGWPAQNLQKTKCVRYDYRTKSGCELLGDKDEIYLSTDWLSFPLHYMWVHHTAPVLKDCSHWRCRNGWPQRLHNKHRHTSAQSHIHIHKTLTMLHQLSHKLKKKSPIFA